MNKDKARQILQDWMSNNQQVILPIKDEVIYKGSEEGGDQGVYTFRYLIKCAYDLIDAPEPPF